MNRMRSIILPLTVLTVVLAGGAIFLLGRMGGDGGTQEPESVNLQWWGVFWDSEVVASLIEEYQTLNPGVTVSYANKWPGGNREVASKLYQDEINRVLKDRNPVAIPDIFMVENTWAGNYEAFTAPAPEDIISAQTLATNFYSVVSTDFARGGIVRGIPLWIDSLAIVYNRDILAQQAVSAPPEDWVDFRNLAVSLTRRTGSTITQAGFAAGTTANVSFSTELANLILLQNSVVMLSSQGNPVFANDINSQGAVSFYKSFSGPSGSWNAQMENDSAAFLNGKLAMLAVPSWRLQDMLYFNEVYNLNLNIGVAPMPQLQSQNQPRQNWATYWGNMVSQDRPNSREAWKFMEWMSRPEQLRKLRANDSLKRQYVSFIYPRPDMQNELQSLPHIGNYLSGLSSSTSWYMVNGLTVKEIFNELLDSSGTSSNLNTAQSKIQQLVNNKGIL